MGTQQIRYYAKIDAEGRTWYFGGMWAHLGSANALGKVLGSDVREQPDAELINCPEPGWDEEYHSDGVGEYQLRPLSQGEEENLLYVFQGAE